MAGLRVPGRSSSFWFKGKNVGLSGDRSEARRDATSSKGPSGGRGASSDLGRGGEGVERRTGLDETYEREVTDVFAIQDGDRAIGGPRTGTDASRRTSPPPPATTTDPEAYRLFLLGRAVNAQGTRESYRRAKEALERSVAIDPRFAPAQAYLAVVLGNCSLTERGGESQRLRSAGKAAAERAVAIESVVSVGVHQPGVVPDAAGP